jgi:hypothetical protein
MLSRNYTPPEGSYDLPFTWIFDGTILQDNQTARQLPVQILPGFGDFVLRRIVGLDRVLNPQTGQYQIYNKSNVPLEADPVFVQGGGELAIIPETEYPEKFKIMFDLYNILRSISTGGGISATQRPVQVDTTGTESGFPGTMQTLLVGPFAYKGALYGLFGGLSGAIQMTAWRSADNGATWQQQDGAHSPTFSTSEVYNTSFDPVGGVITFLYNKTGNVMRWGTFNCNTNLFSDVVFPDLTDWNTGASIQADFVLRTDGTVVVIYTQTGAGHVVYRILSGGVWGAANQATPATAGHAYVEFGAILDPAGTTHFIYEDTVGGAETWTHVALSALNVLGAPGAITNAIQLNGDFIQRGVIFGNSIILPVARIFAGGTQSKASLFIGTPLNAPVWTVVDIESVAGSGSILHSNLLVNGATCYFLYQFDPTIATDQIHLSINSGSGFGAPSTFYDAVLNPPPNTVPVAAQFIQDVEGVITPNGSLAAFATMEIVGGFFPAFYLTGSGGQASTAFVAFQGSARFLGKEDPMRASAPKKFKAKSKTFVLQGTITQTGQLNLNNAPITTVVQKISDYDFDLYELRFAFQGAPSSPGGPPVSLPDPIPNIAIFLYDSVHNRCSNLPVLDIYYDGSPGSPYKNGALVPPLYYPKESIVRLDLYSLITDPTVLPMIVTIHLVGMWRFPC